MRIIHNILLFLLPLIVLLSKKIYASAIVRAKAIQDKAQIPILIFVMISNLI